MTSRSQPSRDEGPTASLPPSAEQAVAFTDCWHCGGEGYVYDCFDGFCEDADYGCDQCERSCHVCDGTGVIPARGVLA